MARDYTRREAEAIRSAFSALTYLAEVTDINAPHRLREAERYERRQRSSATVARALMVAQALAGLNARAANLTPATPAELYAISPGLATAHMFGADVGRRYWTACASVEAAGRLSVLIRDFRAAAEKAGAAHDAAGDRARAALREAGQ